MKLKNGKSKASIVLLAAILLLSTVTGCGSKTDTKADPDKKAEGINSFQTSEGAVTSNEATTENNEYALRIGDMYCRINDNLTPESMTEVEKTEEIPADEPFPAGKRYFGDGFEVDTFLLDDGSGQREVIVGIFAEKDAETPRGIGIGDSLEKLQKAYPDLIYENGAYSYDTEPKFNRSYVYAPDDGTVNYIQFYLYNKIIVKIEAGKGEDMRPGSWQPYIDIFGKENIFKEIGEVTSKGMNTRYFYINDSGEEETLLDINSRCVEERDLDEDGVTELLVYLMGDLQAIGVYDYVNGEISYIDINETLQCYYSLPMGEMANIKRENGYYINAAFKNEDGTVRSEVYRIKDNQLTYVGPLSDEMFM